MATVCNSSGRLVRVRLTRLNECGIPVVGACSVVVSDAAVQVTDTAVYFDDDEIEQTNGNGDRCVYDLKRGDLKRDDVQIQLCRIDPDAINIMTEYPLVTDAATPTPNTIGFSQESGLPIANFALEIWQKVFGVTCTDPDEVPYQYWIWPWLSGGRVEEDLEFGNAATTLTATAFTHEDSPWGVGPDTFLVQRDGLGALSPLLNPITAQEHRRTFFTTAPPPTAACGCVALAADTP